MKVLLISSDKAVFDTESGVRARMQSYAEKMEELHILVRTSHALSVRDGNLHLYGVMGSRILAPLLLARRARYLLRTKGIDVVSAQDPFEHGWAALRAVRGTRAKLHIQAHTDFLSPWFRNALGVPSLRMRLLNIVRVYFADYVLPHASGIRVVSLRIQESLEKRYGSRIVTPTIIPITLPLAAPEFSVLPGTAFKLITVSRLEPEKRIGDVLDAFVQVQKTHPDIQLIIVGSGRDRTLLERKVRGLGLAHSVQFLGERADAWGLMCGAQLFIQASAYEGYGRTLIEAALARVPIITTDVGVVGDVLLPDRDILVFPIGDSKALAERIVYLIESPRVRSELVAAAERAAQAHLTSLEDQSTAICADLKRALGH